MYVCQSIQHLLTWCTTLQRKIQITLCWNFQASRHFCEQYIWTFCKFCQKLQWWDIFNLKMSHHCDFWQNLQKVEIYFSQKCRHAWTCKFWSKCTGGPTILFRKVFHCCNMQQRTAKQIALLCLLYLSVDIAGSGAPYLGGTLWLALLRLEMVK